MATRSSRHGDDGARVVVGFGTGDRGRGSGGEEWTRGVSSIDVVRLGSSGGSWRLGARRGGVGGFPPSTLGARGGRRQGRSPGGLDWARRTGPRIGTR